MTTTDRKIIAAIDRPAPSPANTRRAVLRALAQAEMSQAELARRVGTSPQTMGQLLLGRRPITDEMLVRIVEAIHGRVFVRAALAASKKNRDCA